MSETRRYLEQCWIERPFFELCDPCLKARSDTIRQAGGASRSHFRIHGKSSLRFPDPNELWFLHRLFSVARAEISVAVVCQSGLRVTRQSGVKVDVPAVDYRLLRIGAGSRKWSLCRC